MLDLQTSNGTSGCLRWRAVTLARDPIWSLQILGTLHDRRSRSALTTNTGENAVIAQVTSFVTGLIVVYQCFVPLRGRRSCERMPRYQPRGLDV